MNRSGAAAAVAGALLLSGCAGPDGDQARLCRSTLPALLPDERIEVTGWREDGRLANAVRVEYRAGEAAGALRCVFGGGRLDDRRLDLVAVEVAGRPLGDAGLLFLKRFWLADRQAVVDGERRLEGPPAAPLVPGRVDASTGYFLQQAVNAAPVGAQYALLALAYAFVYGLTGRINLAFGQVAVIGSFALAAVMGPLVLASAGGGVGVVLLAVAAAALAAASAGAATGSLVFAPLARAAHRPFLIATIGLAVAAGEGVRLLAGSRDIWIQPVLNDPVLIVGGGFAVTVTPVKALECLAAAAGLAILAAVMAKSRFGRAWRATADDPGMAGLLGVDTGRVALATFVLSAAIAGAAGALSALHYGHVSPHAGLVIGLKALAAAILGGLGSLPGAALGGFAIGVAETMWSAYLPLANRDAAILALLVAVLVLRPHGLFGRPAADRWAQRG